MVGMVDETMNEDKPKWWSFLAWPIVGAALAFSILALMTIGIIVLPFALVGLFALLRWGGNRKSSAGLISGVGLPLIYIAFLNRDGPGDICTPYGSGGQQCTQEWSPWPWLVVGLGLVIWGVWLFLRLRRNGGVTSESGNDEALTATAPTPHPLDLPIENRARKLVASGAVIWTITGSIVAISGLATVNRDAKPFFSATILLATLAGIGATFSALRGKRRATILLLFVSVIYPTYFGWELSLVPIILACYLLFNPFVTSFRNPEMRLRNIQVLSFLAIAILIGLAWMKYHVDPNASTESKRVQNAFNAMFLAVSTKDAVPTRWLTPEHAGSVTYTDGSKASLWVPKTAPNGNRSSCFYVDQPRKGGASGFYDSLCSVPHSEVILERQGRVVVGYVRITRARFATITSGGITVDAPITFGYFIFPSVVSEDSKAIFAISFVDPGGATCKVVDLPAPGSATSIECVIA